MLHSPRQHGVQENSQTPDITGSVITLPHQYLAEPNKRGPFRTGNSVSTLPVHPSGALLPPPLPPWTLPHLWRHKVGGVTGGEEQAVAPPQLLGEAKVTDPDGVGVPRVVHVQDVAGFQVSVYHLGGRKGGRKLAEMEAGR